ncbi:MAG TPA: hypothetical protein VHG52_00520 [Thermomicrobiales bacterium]|nr:hypothetical protein [Thermomicrobiales bacterium]
MTTMVANVVGRRLRPRNRRLRRALSSGQPQSAAAPTPPPSSLSPPTRTSPTPASGGRLVQPSAMPGEE